MVRRRTRILATIGPASREPAVLDALVAAGLDAVRLNFSHGTHESHAENVRRVRDASARAGREVAILQDLQGPKIRLGKVDGQMRVLPGSKLVITTRDIVGANGVVPTDFADLPREAVPDHVAQQRPARHGLRHERVPHIEGERHGVR